MLLGVVLVAKGEGGNAYNAYCVSYNILLKVTSLYDFSQQLLKILFLTRITQPIKRPNSSKSIWKYAW